MSVWRNAESEKLFNSMFVQLVKVTCYKLREERVSSGEETDKNKNVVNGSSGGVFMATAN